MGAGEAGGEDVENLEAGRSGTGFDGGDGFLVEERVSDDAAFGDVGGGEFELRFYEDEKVGLGGGAGDGGSKNFANRDEGEVGGNESSGLGNFAGRESAGVVFDLDDTGISLECPGELMSVDVDGEDALGAMVEETISEAAGGGADVEAGEADGIEREIGEGGFEFEAGAGGEFLASGEFEAGVGGDRSAGFVGAEAVEADFAGEDEGVGKFLSVGEPALDQSEIKAGAPRFRLHGAR